MKRPGKDLFFYLSYMILVLTLSSSVASVTISWDNAVSIENELELIPEVDLVLEDNFTESNLNYSIRRTPVLRSIIDNASSMATLWFNGRSLQVGINNDGEYTGHMNLSDIMMVNARLIHYGTNLQHNNIHFNKTSNIEYHISDIYQMETLHFSENSRFFIYGGYGSINNSSFNDTTLRLLGTNCEITSSEFFMTSYIRYSLPSIYIQANTVNNEAVIEITPYNVNITDSEINIYLLEADNEGILNITSSNVTVERLRFKFASHQPHYSPFEIPEIYLKYPLREHNFQDVNFNFINYRGIKPAVTSKDIDYEYYSGMAFSEGIYIFENCTFNIDETFRTVVGGWNDKIPVIYFNNTNMDYESLNIYYRNDIAKEQARIYIDGILYTYNNNGHSWSQTEDRELFTITYFQFIISIGIIFTAAIISFYYYQMHKVIPSLEAKPPKRKIQEPKKNIFLEYDNIKLNERILFQLENLQNNPKMKKMQLKSILINNSYVFSFLFFITFVPYLIIGFLFFEPINLLFEPIKIDDKIFFITIFASGIFLTSYSVRCGQKKNMIKVETQSYNKYAQFSNNKKITTEITPEYIIDKSTFNETKISWKITDHISKSELGLIIYYYDSNCFIYIPRKAFDDEESYNDCWEYIQYFYWKNHVDSSIIKDIRRL